MPNVNHNPYPQLAGNVDLGSFEPTYIFAGQKQIVTQPFPVGATALVQYQAVALDATNKLVPHDPTASDTTKVMVGVTTLAAPANSSVGIYTSAFLNHEIVVWHASLDTFDKRRAASLSCEVDVGKVTFA